MPTVVIPFRGDGKSRLALPERERREVALSMLRRVLAAAEDIGDVVVVTDDEEARSLAPRWVDDPGGGQGAAVAAALVNAAGGPTLVVNADLPTIEARDLRRLLDAIPPGGVALVEAADGTTNALGLADPSLFAPLYGPGSAARFKARGAIAVDVPGLAEDLDTL